MALNSPIHGYTRNRRSVFAFAVAVSVALVGSTLGCSSSEETGAARRAENPAPERVNAQQFPQAGDDTVMVGAPSGTASQGRAIRPSKRPSVRRGQDTVRASTSRTTKANTQRPALTKPPDAMYTVQVGAFRRAPNALELQKSLKQEHGDQPVFSLFQETEGLYKVTIGKFETLGEASTYRKKLLSDHPKRFTECWVTYIERSR